MVAGAVSGFKGIGETHNSNLTKLADEFDGLSQIEDPTELRSRLHEGVENLRRSAEEMRRDTDASVRQFESQMSAFQQRLERARKDSATDRLTGLGSRLEAARHLRGITSLDQAICFQLFDIEGFGEINRQHGTLFGDQLLTALAHLLCIKFVGQAGLFRWAADEFVVIAEGSIPSRVAQCGEIRRSFADGRYLTVKDGVRVKLSADVAYGVAQYTPGEGIEETYRRARLTLEQNRQKVRR
jgi:diguanylate cyclase